MEAELVDELPEGDGWQYEPKWDGFRGVLENVWRRAAPLEPQRAAAPPLLPGARGRSATAAASLGARRRDRDRARRARSTSTRCRCGSIRPRAGSASWRRRSRPPSSASTCSSGTARQSARLPLAERRARVEQLPFDVSPATLDVDEARALARAPRGRGLRRRDREAARPPVPGRLARGRPQGEAAPDRRLRRRRAPLEEDEREGSRRSCSASTTRRRSSRYVGSARSARSARKRRSRERVLPLLEDAPDRRSPSRTAGEAGELEEAAVRPELVVEARYDKWQGNRFRHGTRFVRWRPDKDPPSARSRRSARGRSRATRRSPGCSGDELKRPRAGQPPECAGLLRPRGGSSDQRQQDDPRGERRRPEAERDRARVAEVGLDGHVEEDEEQHARGRAG